MGIDTKNVFISHTHEDDPGLAKLKRLLDKHRKDAGSTDQLKGQERHTDILALGLVGEIGGVLAERKKGVREANAYPHYREKLTEELGDVLWYLLRIAKVTDYDLNELYGCLAPSETRDPPDDVAIALDDAAVALGVAGGKLLTVTQERGCKSDYGQAIERVAKALAEVVAVSRLDWPGIVDMNRKKIFNLWPRDRQDQPLSEITDLEVERFPKRVCVEFRKVDEDTVILRANGLNIGDRLTDNMKEPDYYRFHDVFHFSYAVLLGWSPVLRALLRCKRKSKPDIDVNEDGARAQIVEEAVSAHMFANAKEMKYYEGVDHLDYDLLKAVQELVNGYEVDSVPLYLWEEAILAGYRVFRELVSNQGGIVDLDFEKRQLSYRPATTRKEDATV